MATTTPAYKTLGFWATVVLTNVGLLLASGAVIGGTVASLIGWAVTVLSALGYKGWQKAPDALPPGQ